MGKKRNRSRLIKSDVNSICQMQRKIDAYENYIIALAGHSCQKKDTQKYVVCVMGTDMDDWANMAFNNITKMKEKLSEYEKERDRNPAKEGEGSGDSQAECR